MLKELKKKVEEGLDPKVFAKQLIDELDNDTVLDVIITSFDEETIQNALEKTKGDKVLCEGCNSEVYENELSDCMEMQICNKCEAKDD